MKKMLKVVMLVMALLFCMSAAGCHGDGNAQTTSPQNAPWESGGKKPSEYTWKEYETLSDAQQASFYAWFASAEDFEQWQTAAQINDAYAALPWNNGGKTPSEYTWKEYEGLDMLQQSMFAEWFASVEAYETWLEEARRQESYGDLPWNNGGKKPSEYTWGEYEALTAAQQAGFFAWFELVEDYEAWLNRAQKQDVQADLPWENGGKKPAQYTWEEYEALSNSQRGAFLEWFESTKAFEEWMNEAKKAETSGSLPWENGGKKPSEYTWKEFEALNDEQKERFSEWFQSAAAFEQWMSDAKQKDYDAGIPWKNGGKQPVEYTWTEFEALNIEQQELFFEWFDTAEAFEEWMNDAKS